MAKPFLLSTKAIKAIIYLFFLGILCANAARILAELEGHDPVIVDPPATPTVVPPPTTTLPSGQFPAANFPSIPPVATADEEADPPLPETDIPASAAPPVEEEPSVTTPPPVNVASPLPAATIPTATSSSTVPAAPTVGTTATVGKPAGPQTTAATTSPTLSFFMHDILGGSHPSVRVVTGLIARTDINGIPFSVPNNNFFPLQGATPLVNINNLNNLINPNTAPLLTGLNGAQPSTILQNTGNNNNVVNSNNQPFVTAGQIPAGSALQKLMFGSITVIDDELTEGHELGSAVMGKAQGFYLASSLDGSSHTMALTLLLHGGENHGLEYDTISLFGVHRTASPESQIAVIGGTGKYEHAKGFATVETLHQEDQHTTDGVDTIMHFNVYLSE